MEENNQPEQEKIEVQCVPVPILVWIGKYALSGIIYSVATFFTTICLKKWRK